MSIFLSLLFVCSGGEHFLGAGRDVVGWIPPSPVQTGGCTRHKLRIVLYIGSYQSTCGTTSIFLFPFFLFCCDLGSRVVQARVQAAPIGVQGETPHLPCLSGRVRLRGNS
jgi:hypothetical protein